MLIRGPESVSLVGKFSRCSIRGPVIDQHLGKERVCRIVKIWPSDRIAEEQEELIRMADTGPVTVVAKITVSRLV